MVPIKTYFRRARTAVAPLALVPRALQLIWEASGPFTATWLIVLLVQGLLPAGIVYVTKWLVDSIAAIVDAGAGSGQLDAVIPPAVLMGAMLILQRVLGSAMEWIRTAQSEFVKDHVKGLIHEKASAVEYSFYESSEYYDLLEQANSQAGPRILALLENLGTLLRTSVTFISISLLLIPYSALLPLLLVVSTLPAFIILIRHNRRYHEWWKATTPSRRWASYYDTMLTLHASAAEVRIYNLGAYFRKGYDDLRREIRSGQLRIVRDLAIARLFASGLALLVTAGTMAWILLRAMRGLATLGDLALFYQAFNQGQALAGTLLGSTGQIYANVLFLSHLYAFLDQENDVKDPETPMVFVAPRDAITFENITFTYPGTREAALSNFDLTVEAGKITAIVGANGAGKSTLVKLLCRFYDPDAGRVAIDGTDIRRLRQRDLRRQISVMFQFPMKYQMTAAENIAIGDLDVEPDLDRLRRSAVGAGAHEFISALPNGYRSLLGRYFEEGTELSGGEWQRIALARAFWRDANIVVLDEPTSFMDSWAEIEWLQRFRRLVEGRTSLIITHRFTTAMQADIIHVMSGGEIVESGTHDELVEIGGSYAASWASQVESRDRNGEASPGKRDLDRKKTGTI